MGYPPEKTQRPAHRSVRNTDSLHPISYFLLLISYFSFLTSYFLPKKSLPAEPFQNKRIRNPAAARTVPSRMVCATSFLSWRRRGMRLTAHGGRSAYPAPEARAPFYSLWVFTLISISVSAGRKRIQKYDVRSKKYTAVCCSGFLISYFLFLTYSSTSS